MPDPESTLDSLIYKPLRPIFDAARWNRDPLLKGTNCYTYALNLPECGWSIPGSIAAAENKMINVVLADPKKRLVDPKDIRAAVRAFKAAVRDAMLHDGLVLIEAEELDRHSHVLAAYLGKENGEFGFYHFYRRDEDGTWSHKNASARASNTDNEGKIIRDPRTAARDYHSFTGFYAVPEEGIAYIPRLEI